MSCSIKTGSLSDGFLYKLTGTATTEATSKTELYFTPPVYTGYHLLLVTNSANTLFGTMFNELYFRERPIEYGQIQNMTWTWTGFSNVLNVLYREIHLLLVKHIHCMRIRFHRRYI